MGSSTSFADVQAAHIDELKSLHQALGGVRVDAYIFVIHTTAGCETAVKLCNSSAEFPALSMTNSPSWSGQARPE